MRKLFLLPLLLLYGSILFCQNTIRFLVQQPEPFEEKLYIAGSFNDWNPGDNNYLLKPFDAKHMFVDVKVPPGHYEYKFTRGVWNTVEGAETGLDISNRAIDVRRDTIVNIVIQGWMDKFKNFSNLPDSTQWYVFYSRSFFYLDINIDSSYRYAQQANAMLGKLDNKKYEADLYRILGRIMQRQGNHQRALEYYLKQLSIVQELKDTLSMAFCLLDIGHLFLAIKDYANAKNYYLQVSPLDPAKTSSFGRSAPNLAIAGIGKVYYHTHQLDSARFYALKAYDLSLKATDRPGQSEALTLLGNILEDEGRPTEAINYYQLAIRQAQLFNSSSNIAENYQNIARAFFTNSQVDSSLHYARKAFVVARDLKNPLTIVDASNLLVMLFKNTGQTDSAFRYLETVVAAKDSLLNQDQYQQLQTILFNEELQKQESKAAAEKLKSGVKTYIIAAAIILLLFLLIFLWWNNKRRQGVNKLLKEQGEKMQNTLVELKNLRSRLSQKEKMASFGEFAAGIAHEIQDPLTVINNLSEINTDIAKELKQELSSLNISPDQQSKLNSIAEKLVQNQQKITGQGHRADVIVKDMLQRTENTPGEDKV